MYKYTRNHMHMHILCMIYTYNNTYMHILTLYLYIILYVEDHRSQQHTIQPLPLLDPYHPSLLPYSTG